MDYSNLDLLLKKIIGQQVWDFRFGEATGSIFTFEFGNKTPLLGKKNKSHEGEGSFMVYSSWRLIKENKIILSSKDELQISEWNSLSLSILEDKKIESIILTKYLDVSIYFDDFMFLQLFCDIGLQNDFDCNWFLRLGKIYYSITNSGTIDLEDYSL